MTQNYETVATFFENPDAHAEFLKRVTTRLVEWAVAERENVPATPTAQEVARQEFAVRVLAGAAAATAQARRILPALAVEANQANLIDEDGYITATDAQILNTIDDDFVDLHAGHVPAAA